MVEKFDLQVIPNPKPYKLQWINEDEELTVDKRVKVSLFVGNYKDEILCDVVSMEAYHILLGRPWQFDKKIIPNGLTNEITFTHREKKFVFYPLTPSQVVKDQVQMKQKGENEKKKKIENQEKVLRDNTEAWEKSVPSHNVIQIEEKFEKKIKLKKILLFEQPSGLLLCKGTLACIAILSEVCELPPQFKRLLKEFGDVFPKEGPIGLPPFWGIEHQIDLVPGAILPNRPAYRTNPEETNEIESQV